MSRGSASEIDRIGTQIDDGRKIFAEWLESREHCQQRFGRSRLDDQSIAFLTHDRLAARKLELAGNAYSSIAAILENLNAAL